jgi:O-antigen ligase
MLNISEKNLVSFLLFTPLIFALSIEHWLSAWFGILLLTALIRVKFHSFNWIQQDKDTKILLWLGLAMFLSTLLSNTIAGWTHSNVVRFEVDSKQFFSLFILVYLFNFKDIYHWFFRALPIAGIILPISIYFYQNGEFHDYGNHAVYGQIIMSDWSALLFFLILLSKKYANWSSERLANGLLYLGLVGSFISMSVSLSRNGWLVFLVLSCMFFIFYYQDIKKHFVKLLLLFIGVIVIALLTPISGYIKTRILSVGDDVTFYFSGEKKENFQGSQNHRLEQWTAALKTFPQKPLFGFGGGGVTKAVNDMIDLGKAPESVRFGAPHHVHNQQITTLLDKGLLGMLLQLSFLLFILWVFFKHRHQDKKVAMLGMVFIVAHLVFGLTEVPFIRNNHTAIFYLILPILWHMKNNQEKQN